MRVRETNISHGQVTEKFKPHKSLRPKLKGKKPAAVGKVKKRLEAGSGDTIYSETRNGQIEVVKSIKQTRVKGSRAPVWVVECVPKVIFL